MMRETETPPIKERKTRNKRRKRMKKEKRRSIWCETLEEDKIISPRKIDQQNEKMTEKEMNRK